ncbi:MAG: ribonuclease P protein component [Armatimonadetes bacterium]|nr:ribonuclease P protein component [Armatimonadota bacterium]
MLPPAARLRRTADFQRLYSRGRRFPFPPFVLYAWQRDDDEPTRIGFVFSRKFGGAVHRNRHRRRLRAICREIWPNMAQGYDLAFVGRDAIKALSATDLRQLVQDALNKAGVLP